MSFIQLLGVAILAYQLAFTYCMSIRSVMIIIWHYPRDIAPTNIANVDCTCIHHNAFITVMHALVGVCVCICVCILVPRIHEIGNNNNNNNIKGIYDRNSSSNAKLNDTK